MPVQSAAMPSRPTFPPLEYSHAVRGWRGMIGDGCELMVAGNREEPSPFRLPLAKEVVSDFPDVVALAAAYLDSFVSPGRFDLGGWSVVGLDVGRVARLSAGDWFELTLAAEHDLYGRWSVGMAPSVDGRPTKYIPFWFGRKQI